MFRKILYQFAIQNKKHIKVIEAEKLLFDESNKCLIFRQQNGEEHLQWGVRGISLFTALNCILASQEYINPLFGGWNTFSYSLCTLVGLSGLAFLKIVGKRTIYEMRLMKPGDYVEITYFNAFWTPKTVPVHISEFQNLSESYFGYHRVEMTSIGKAWINIEKNEFAEQFEDQKVLYRILSGIPIQLDTQRIWKKQQ